MAASSGSSRSSMGTTRSAVIATPVNCSVEASSRLNAAKKPRNVDVLMLSCITPATSQNTMRAQTSG